MVTTTLAHVAENKIYRLLCMGGLALIQSICFANFTDNHYFYGQTCVMRMQQQV